MNGAHPWTLWNGQFGAAGPNMGTEANWTAGNPIAISLGYLGLETGHRRPHRPPHGSGRRLLRRPARLRALFDAAFPDFAEDERTRSRRLASPSPPTNARSWATRPPSSNGYAANTPP